MKIKILFFKHHRKSNVYYFTVSNGYLDSLIYLHENGFPWDENTCSYAALNGHLDCLKYAIEHGCPHREGHYKIYAKNFL